MRFIAFVLLSLHLATRVFSSACDGDAPPFQARIAATATRVYAILNEKWSYPEASAPYHTESSFWDTPRCFYILCLDQAMLTKHAQGGPLDFCAAYDSLLNAPSMFECATAHRMVMTMCMREYVGDERFNVLGNFLWNRLVNANRTGDFFNELSEVFLFAVGSQETPVIGGTRYLINLLDYPALHPQGNGKGQNLVCVGQDQYLGFGEIFKSGPLSRIHVLQDLHEAYGVERLTFEAFLKQQDEAQHSKLHYNTVCCLSEARLAHFIKTGEVTFR